MTTRPIPEPPETGYPSAVDDPLVLARAARIVRVALARRAARLAPSAGEVARDSAKSPGQDTAER